jgi:hypothetical protein
VWYVFTFKDDLSGEHGDNNSSEFWKHIQEEHLDHSFHQTANFCATSLSFFSINVLFSDLMKYGSMQLGVHSVCGKLWAPQSLHFHCAPHSNLDKFHKIFQSVMEITDVTWRADLFPVALQALPEEQWNDDQTSGHSHLTFSSTVFNNLSHSRIC